MEALSSLFIGILLLLMVWVFIDPLGMLKWEQKLTGVDRTRLISDPVRYVLYCRAVLLIGILIFIGTIASTSWLERAHQRQERENRAAQRWLDEERLRYERELVDQINPFGRANGRQPQSPASPDQLR